MSELLNYRTPELRIKPYKTSIIPIVSPSLGGGTGEAPPKQLLPRHNMFDLVEFIERFHGSEVVDV